MNKITIVSLLLAFICSFEAKSQSPASFRYQAALQSSTGEQLSSKNVTFMVSILRSAMEKQRVYAEFHSVKTDQFGMVSIEIGKGNPVYRTFAEISWGGDDHFLRVEMDELGGTQFKLLNEVQLLSVPYALHARTADIVDDADADPKNELQSLSLEGRELVISDGNRIYLPEHQTLFLEGRNLSISDGNTVVLPDFQKLALQGLELSISNGNTITLPDFQTLTLRGQQLSISNGNEVTLPENTDNQYLSIDGNRLSISNGNTIELPSTDAPDPAQPVPVLFRGKKIHVHPVDNAEAIPFGSFADTGADSDYDGKTNTAVLVSAYGDGSYAAKLCDDLSAFGYDDWYLPSRAELDAIVKQNYLIADYELDSYWSSTETTSNKAWSLDFTDGSPSDITKNQNKRCRCIRAE